MQGGWRKLVGGVLVRAGSLPIVLVALALSASLAQAQAPAPAAAVPATPTDRIIIRLKTDAAGRALHPRDLVLLLAAP